MKKVAFPIANHKLSEHFGACSHFAVFEIAAGNIQRTTFEKPSSKLDSELVVWLEKQGVTDVIAYHINKEIMSFFATTKVNLFVGIPLNSTERLIEAYLQGKLESDQKMIEEITK